MMGIMPAMEETYAEVSRMLKALADPKRLQIADLLSCGERCACDLLAYFHVTQPTLSHDMKLLLDAGIVRSRREGKHIRYRLDEANLAKLDRALTYILSRKNPCICGELPCEACDEGT